MFKVPEKYRLSTELMPSSAADGNNGLFAIPMLGATLAVIASDGEGWEHVSIHTQKKGMQVTPTWDEMCYAKNLFWGEDDVVVQFHPAKKNYVNNHPNVLHLWRKSGQDWETPPTDLVGIL